MGHYGPVPMDGTGVDDATADPRDDDDDDDNEAIDNAAVRGLRRRRHPLLCGGRGVGRAGGYPGGPVAVGGLLRVEYLDI